MPKMLTTGVSLSLPGRQGAPPYSSDNKYAPAGGRPLTAVVDRACKLFAVGVRLDRLSAVGGVTKACRPKMCTLPRENPGEGMSGASLLS